MGSTGLELLRSWDFVMRDFVDDGNQRFAIITSHEMGS